MVRRGSVEQRGGTWSYRVDEHTTEGRRQRRVGGFASEEDAVDAMNEALLHLRRGGYVPPSQVTVRAWLEQWVDSKARRDLRPSTATSYRSKITRYLVPHLGGVRLQALTTADVDEALGRIADQGGRGGQPLSRRTVRYAQQVLELALDDAVRANRIAVNVARAARPPRQNRAPKRQAKQKRWTAAEARSFLAAVDGERQAAMWRVFVMTGMRRGEVCGLRWSSVDLDRGELVVAANRVPARDADGRRCVVEGPAKTDRDHDEPRRVALDAGTVAALRSHRRRQAEEQLRVGAAWAGDGHVFVNDLGEALDPDAVSRTFRQLLDEHDVRRIRLHDVRHSHASIMLDAGQPIEAVSKRLGHTRISTTYDLYVDADEAAARRAADAFGAVMDKA